MILDACRDNPFGQAMRRTLAGRAIGHGLAKVEVLTTDTLIAFAAKAGSTADDGQGINSPYTTALIKHLVTPGLDVRLAFGRVRDEVLRSTRGRQEPFVYGSLGGAEIALMSAPAAAAVPPLPPAADVARVCREVEGMSSAALLGVLAAQYKDTPAANCVAARLAELKLAEPAHAAAAAKTKADEHPRATSEPGPGGAPTKLAALPRLENPAGAPSESNPFDGVWTLRITTNTICSSGGSRAIWTWRIRQSAVEGWTPRGAARGTVTPSGQLVALFPAPVDPSKTIRIVAKLQGSRGEGRYEGLGRCGGTVALTRP